LFPGPAYVSLRPVSTSHRQLLTSVWRVRNLLREAMMRLACIFTGIRQISQQLTFMDFLHKVHPLAHAYVCMYTCTRGSATRAHNQFITSSNEKLPNAEFKMLLVIAGAQEDTEWPVSFSGGPDSIPDQVIWDLCCTEWQWGAFSPSTCFPCQFSFHKLLNIL
jgi:hypothetical protein